MAGLTFYLEVDDELWAELEEGPRLALIRDWHNRHDSHVVAEGLVDDYDDNQGNIDFKFAHGYILLSDNAKLAILMNAGSDENSRP